MRIMTPVPAEDGEHMEITIKHRCCRVEMVD